MWRKRKRPGTKAACPSLPFIPRPDSRTLHSCSEKAKSLTSCLAGRTWQLCRHGSLCPGLQGTQAPEAQPPSGAFSCLARSPGPLLPSSPSACQVPWAGEGQWRKSWLSAPSGVQLMICGFSNQMLLSWCKKAGSVPFGGAEVVHVT